MKENFYWKIVGYGKHELVLLHGWASNSDIWNYIIDPLSPYFRIHLTDLPGYGNNQLHGISNILEMTEILISKAPENSFWLGWSLGGLIAIQIADQLREKIRGLIMVCSSPCFCQEKGWFGIRKELLNNFSKQLKKDFSKTISRFFHLQTFGTTSAKNDKRILENVMYEKPIPNIDTLSIGLSLLRYLDLRIAFARLKIPVLYIHGKLDKLIPNEVVPLIGGLCSFCRITVFSHSAHVPFISHTKQFCQTLIKFVSRTRMI